jgi:RNA polymerase sigma factor (sigma-70 family)
MSVLPARLSGELLDAAAEVSLAKAMEAGALAGEALASGTAAGGATETELRLLVELGEAARRQFVESNLRLVAMVARQAAARTGLAEGDLFGEGSLGLLAAVARFDHRRGCRFATYALFWIRAYVGAATAGQLGQLELPSSRAGRLRSVRGVEAALSQRLGRTASAAEVATELGRSTRWVGELLGRLAPVPLTLVESEALALPSPNENTVERQDRELLVARLLAQLDPAQRSVLKLRLGFGPTEPMSYAAVARQLDLPISRVRHLERLALARLRDVCPQSASEHL